MKKRMILSIVVTMICFAPLLVLDNAMAYEHMTAKEAFTFWLTHEDAVLLDVRTLEELNWVGSPAYDFEDGAGLVPISIVIPWQFEIISDNGTITTVQNKKFERIVERHFELGRPIIIFCRSGGRSSAAAEALEAVGYTHIAEIDTEAGGEGGFQGGKNDSGYRGYPGRLESDYQVSWMDSGLPVTQKIDPELILTIKKPKD